MAISHDDPAPAAPHDEGPIERWTEEDAEIDRLYREALAAVDAIEADMRLPWNDAPSDGGANSAPARSDPGAATHEDGASRATLTVGSGPDAGALNASAADSPSPDILSMATAGSDGAERVTPEQVLEAVLFVGGGPLATKRLVHLLRDEFTPEYVDDALDRLNRRYLDEGRPYEIQLVDGGWQLALRSEHEKVRHRVYGLGPKEIKLSQEALEVLALVAYHQPLSDEEIVALGKASPGTALRQLLRRELISLERGKSRKDVKYRTTARFLQLFDLRSLDDLPQAEEIAFK